MSEKIHVTVLITTQPGKSSEQVSAFERLAPLVRAEDGCLRYELTQAVEDDNQFVLVESWASDAALKAHDNTPHMIAADAHNPEFRAKPATVYLTRDI